MIIAIDIRKINDSGIGIYLRNLINEISKIDINNSYLLIANKGSDLSYINNLSGNFRIIYIKSKVFSLFEHFELLYVLYREKVDLFHSTHYYLPIIKVCPYIVTIYDLIPILFPEQFSFTKSIYLHLMIKWAITKADLILSISHATSSDIVRKYGNIMNKKIRVIFLDTGMDTNMATLIGEGVFENHGIIKKNYILYAGLGKKHKNLNRLIDAYKIACPKRDIQLVLAGDIKSNELSNSDSNGIIFTGKLNVDELIQLYKHAKIFALVSLYEGFGLPILEAMNAGAPVVTSNLSSMKEIAEGAALLVDPYNLNDISNALNKLIQNKNFRNNLIQKGYERAKQFSWKKTALQTLAAYNEILLNNEYTPSK